MYELTVHILGTGSVGLAYGYLLSARGHRVFHTSLRGIILGEVPVHVQNSTATIHSAYAPQYLLSEKERLAFDLDICAIPHTVCRQYLSGAYGPVLSPPLSHNLFFTSAYDPAGYQSILSQYDRNSCLVYPLISSEHSPEVGLSFVTNSSLEVFLSPTSSKTSNSSLVSLLERSGLTASYHASLDRLRVRYVQTAAVYAVLRAIHLGIIERSGVDAALIRNIFTELSAMAERPNAEPPFDAAEDPGAYFSLISSLILACGTPRRADILLRNINYLLTGGQRKVISHMNVIRNPWSSYFSSLPVSSHTKTQLIISAVLATCSD